MAKILIVDDSEAVREAYSELLGEEHQVCSASGWDTAYRYLFEEDMDLLMIDIDMPVLTGDQMAKILLVKLHSPPKIVLVSGLPEETVRERAQESGCAGYIHKSYPNEKILELVREFLQVG